MSYRWFANRVYQLVNGALHGQGHHYHGHGHAPQHGPCVAFGRPWLTTAEQQQKIDSEERCCTCCCSPCSCCASVVVDDNGGVENNDDRKEEKNCCSFRITRIAGYVGLRRIQYDLLNSASDACYLEKQRDADSASCLGMVASAARPSFWSALHHRALLVLGFDLGQPGSLLRLFGPEKSWMHVLPEAGSTSSSSEENKASSVETDSRALSSQGQQKQVIASPVDSALHAAQEELHRAHARLVTRVEANLGLDLLLEGVSGRGGLAGGRRLASRGLALLRSAAASGDAEAMHNLGVAHERGLGEKPSAKKALVWYERAASLGYAASLFNLAVFTQKGVAGVLPADEAKAQLLFRQAEDARRDQEKQPDDDSAAVADYEDFCKACEEQGWHKDDTAAAKPPANSHDSPHRLYLLARAYHLGLSGVAVDKVLALELYRSAANYLDEAKSAFDSLNAELSAGKTTAHKSKPKRSKDAKALVLRQKSTSSTLSHSASSPAIFTPSSPVTSSSSPTWPGLQSSMSMARMDTMSPERQPMRIEACA